VRARGGPLRTRWTPAPPDRVATEPGVRRDAL